MATDRYPAGAELVVVGSGELARAVCLALAEDWRRPALVLLVARSAPAARRLCQLADARARPGGGARFRAAALDGAFGRLLGRARPALVLNCASYQSSWELVARRTAWATLVGAGGFGVTLPLQAGLAVRLAREVADHAPAARFLNASYPDAVNPALAALGLPVLCGVGNVALLAAGLQSALDLPDQRQLQVLGHHAHLRGPAGPAGEALAWHRGQALGDVAGLLAPQRDASRTDRNLLAGHTAARLVAWLLDGDEVATSLPGPLGLPGGYPVRARRRRIELRLPAGWTTGQAVAWNQRAAWSEGVQVTAGGDIRFTQAARRALEPHLPELATGFPADRLPDACTGFLALRERLRRLPATAPVLAAKE
jgi:hypothetical protein